MKKWYTLFALLALTGSMAAQSPSGHTVALSWTLPTDATSASVYNVYRAPGLCSANGTFAPIGNVTAAVSYTDKTVVGGTSYCYYVTQVANGFESGPSNKADATTVPDPKAPGGLTVVAK